MNTTIYTEHAPAPIGPYSQAVLSNGFVFTAGQVGLTPDGNMVEGGVAAQTHQAIMNLSAVLQAAGTTLQSVVKTTIFLADMNDFAEVNGVYAEFFNEAKPARSTVQAARLPKDALVEIEVIAVVAGA